MKLLFDTHAFLWWDTEPDRLSSAALGAISDRSNELTFSVVSAWEIVIKRQLGTLSLSFPLADIIAGQQAANDLQVLQVELPHVLKLEDLPLHHKDPFDRLLIAQAIAEGETWSVPTRRS